MSPKAEKPVMYPTLRKKAKKFVHVSVAKASNLDVANDESPYVVLELDEPTQRHKTEIALISINDTEVVWNQTFIA